MLKTYARATGWISLLLGLIGFFVKDLFGLFQFDTMHNVIHLVIGILGIAAAQYVNWAKPFAQIIGAFYLLVGIAGFFFPAILGMHLEVSENLLHIILGTWGWYVVLGLKDKKSE